MQDNAKQLRLDYECLHTMPTGIREVRVWWDKHRGTWIVGKRLDLSEVHDDADLIEPQVMEMINHPNVVKVQAVAVVDGFAKPMYVVEILMPYYELGSISDAFEEGRTFSPREALKIIQGVLLGLSEMHEVHGILHRDIKSPNLFLTSDSDLIKIGDLGLAGRMDADGKTPTVNAPHLYSPPELFVGSGLNRASDLYAVGVVLRELIHGRFDYSAYSTSDVVDALTAGRNPLRPSDLELPLWACNALRRVIQKATDKDPAKRYQSARQMSAAVAAINTADWRQTDDASWETCAVRNRAHKIRVTATSTRSGTVKISIQRQKTIWRRTEDDVIVPSLRHTDARAAFERANSLAVS